MGYAKINIPKKSKTSSVGENIKIGIRPEHLTINQNAEANWEGKVFVVEKLGSGTFLYIDKDGEPLVVQTGGDTNIKVGDKVKVGFNSERCHIFDKEGKAFN